MDSHSSQEQLVVCTVTHWMKYIPNALKNHLLALLGIALLFTAHIAVLSPVASITYISGFILLLYAHHHFFHKLMSESMYDIFVTTERILYFDDVLFWANNEHEIPLHRIAGIEVLQKGLVQNLLDFGTLWIDTGGGSMDFKRSIPFVPYPEEMSAHIAKLVHTEDVHHSP
jgi:hypothetical protein